MDEIHSVHEFDRGDSAVIALVRDHPAGQISSFHRHPTAQLLYAVEGVMVVTTDLGQWIVPPTRGVWLPIGTWHSVRMVTAVHMRSIFIREDALLGLPQSCCVLAISPLLRELIIAAVAIRHPYAESQRDGRVMRLLLDEIRTLPELPLALPMPQSADLVGVCEKLRTVPGDTTSTYDWATRLGIDVRTLQRRFVRETGLTFGRWQRQARLIAALEQLAIGRKVIDVALELGYESPTAFSTMFKRELGVPPSSFFESSIF
ncbi:AraC-type DNA-binding protein [Formivibrio citricus]|uniref:AraC-type DNA-binding protein n=1 Tax=Formivibrio citricus TaxID=83765 RepID=A0A1I5CK51_9NEIS|nr:helix-turn-helix transcriptional regulator [Formivibrio citricus]SFN87385.1 AraC-type DNA-binding protein [Formivibrio citricus]